MWFICGRRRREDTYTRYLLIPFHKRLTHSFFRFELVNFRTLEVGRTELNDQRLHLVHISTVYKLVYIGPCLRVVSRTTAFSCFGAENMGYSEIILGFPPVAWNIFLSICLGRLCFGNFYTSENANNQSSYIHTQTTISARYEYDRKILNTNGYKEIGFISAGNSGVGNLSKFINYNFWMTFMITNSVQSDVIYFIIECARIEGFRKFHTCSRYGLLPVWLIGKCVQVWLKSNHISMLLNEK